MSRIYVSRRYMSIWVGYKILELLWSNNKYKNNM